MTPSEIVRRTIEFKSPERLAMISDYIQLEPQPTPRQARLWEDFVDDWGCGWAWPHENLKGICTHHPLSELDALDRYAEFPHYRDDMRYQGWAEQVARAKEQGRYVLAHIPYHGIFERLQNLHGLENTLVDLMDPDARPRLEALADRITAIMLELIQEATRRFPGQIDGWQIGDDWGTQRSGFIPLRLWMEFFHPRYALLGRAVKAAGCHWWIHSCGKINELIEGMIQAGFDVVNNTQPRTTDPRTLAPLYKGRVCIRSGPDIQVSLGTEGLRLADIDTWMETFGDSAGGFIYEWCGGGELPVLPDDSPVRRDYQRFSEWSQKIFGHPLPDLLPPEGA